MSATTDQAVSHEVGPTSVSAFPVWPALAVAVLCIALALLASGSTVALLSWAAAATLVGLTAVQMLWRRAGLWRGRVALARLHSVLQDDPAPCLVTDAQGAVRHVNRAALARFGRQPTATVAQALGGLFAQPSAVLYRLQGRAAASGSAREDVVTRRGVARLAVHRVAPGWFLWRFDMVDDRPGAARGADAVSLPMLVAGRTGAVLFANEAMRRLLGLRPRTLDRVFGDQPVQSGLVVTLAAADGPVQAIVAEIPASAERRELYLLPTSAMPAGAVGGAVADLPVPLIRFGPNGAVLAANPLARDMLGLGETELANAAELFDGLGRPVRDWIADVAAGRLPTRVETLRITRWDSQRFAHLTLRAAGPSARDGVIGVLADATEMKTLEAQFTQSQKMQAIGQLAGGVAHDFNNLLTAITGHCDLLLLRHDPGDPDFADLAQISQNANRAAALVSQLLAFSRKQTLRPETVPLAEVLDEVTHLLRRLVGERIQLDLIQGEVPGFIRVDRRQLEQVVVNLVVNARDAMPEGGTIRVETDACRLDAPQVRGRATVPAGRYALIRVVDTGTGMAPEIAEKVFEPFFTTKPVGEGTGLGLSTAYGIVKQSGGYIFVDSTPGAGTTFTLFLPLYDSMPPAPAVPEPPVSAAGAPTQGVVLLVEDEAPVRAFAARALRLRGHAVIEAESAEAALQTLEDPAIDIDVIVSDVIMPGLDGPAWVREALVARPATRVIFVSGYAEESLAAAQSDLPQSVFLPKPFSLEDLARTVQQQLHLRRPVAGGDVPQASES